jgi:uncharacterized tellurite resistance protein B-like protein
MIHLFDSSDKKKIKGHLKNIIHIANLDGRIDENEKNCIEKIGKKSGITPEEIQHIIDDDKSYDYHAPIDLEERFEFLYELIVMILSDNEVDNSELKIFHTSAISLNIDINMIEEITDFLIHKVRNKENPELIFKEFKQILLSKH